MVWPFPAFRPRHATQLEWLSVAVFQIRRSSAGQANYFSRLFDHHVQLSLRPGTALDLNLKSNNQQLPRLIVKANLLETSKSTFMKTNLYVSDGNKQVMLGSETMACSYTITE
jgi:hypothetical protein